MNPRRHKYGVAPKAERTLDGIVFDSKAEMQRYAELKLLERAGTISELKLQPKFAIEINGIHIAYWRGDFSYQEKGAEVVEDVKGVKTPLYKLKKKLVEAIYRFKIVEIS